MRYRHQLIDKEELLKEIEIIYNNHKEPMGSIIVEFDKGNVITKCSNCGQNVNIIDKFCKNCGCQFMEAIECEWRKNNL